jgi:predicted PurR-regulated permease PerM
MLMALRMRRRLLRRLALICTLLALICTLLAFLFYIFLYNIAQHALPARRDRQPQLPYGISLVNSKDSHVPIIAE